MRTFLGLYDVQWYAGIAIFLGVVLWAFIARRRYNRFIGITQRSPLPFFGALVIGVLEWLAILLSRMLILFGLFFLLLVWYNHH
ncbi:hypothetical protein [Chitinophaga sp. Ak27]|uniref:hypothetical protein n=1 Tax=Chitinophaga sp. Ak27 TaxID=2726116 RepID=UPI00145C4BE1|nr:hypothetical protein [Chitinophaga sp. Ak27]NLU94893.1 hypothetical protein [Chitinophaga sp. Ak27]